MKRINKSLPPNALTDYAQEYPTCDWDNGFRNHHAGSSYQKIKERIFLDQGYLCAYCESAISRDELHNQRIEHFHPKSDKSKNWGLDWDNIIGVCLGGNDVDQSKHPLPNNLSCDSYKNHLIMQRKLMEACEGLILSPLHITPLSCLFDLDKRTGELKPIKTGCDQQSFYGNQFTTTFELVEKTILFLNLNCDRLNKQRLAVLYQYEQQVKKARQQNDRDYFSKLAAQWFRNKWPSFFTTRRILLGYHAETYLQNTAYNG